VSAASVGREFCSPVAAMPCQYLEQIRDFALTVKGQDRARGIRVVQRLPSPDQDDDRPISAVILQQIA
jgi:hypothetical protein